MAARRGSPAGGSRRFSPFRDACATPGAAADARPAGWVRPRETAIPRRFALGSNPTAHLPPWSTTRRNGLFFRGQEEGSRDVDAFLNSLNDIIWSMALVGLCLGLGLYFSIRTRFMQVWGVPEMLRLMFNNKSSSSGVSSFQALAVSLAGRVGTGNIAGVATAIAFGGPGAVFWMWAMAFLGASTSYIECTLAQIYKEKDDQGRYRGGPAYYIEKAMGLKWYAWVFAVVTVFACGLMLPVVQVNSLASSMNNAFDRPPLLIAAGIAVPLALIIFGGIKRIASFAEMVVPFMAVAYILVAVVMMALNAERLPAMLEMIMSSAFGLHAGFGAMLGLAVE